MTDILEKKVVRCFCCSTAAAAIDWNPHEPIDKTSTTYCSKSAVLKQKAVSRSSYILLNITQVIQTIA